MIVTLDGERLAGEFAPECTLQALVDEVRRGLAKDALIVTVAVNGERLLDDELSERLTARPRPDDQIDLESGSAAALTADALRDVSDQIAEVGGFQKQIADDLNAGKVAEAVQRVGRFVQAWQSCQQTVAQSSRLLHRDLTQHEYAGRPIGAYLDEVVEKLRELRDALDARDLVLAADLFHYEMPDLCETWRGLLANLADSIHTDPMPSASAL